MPGLVAVHGSGLAACCCARLFRAHGVPFETRIVHAASLPTILINGATQTLLGDVFGDHNLFSGLPAIEQRVVLWGDAPAPLSFPHSGFVIREEELLRRLWAKMPDAPTCSPSSEIAWSIYSSRSSDPASPLPPQLGFGTRLSVAASVLVKPSALRTCWVESLEAGWLFLLPITETHGSLLAVGSSPASLLRQSRLVAGQIESVLSESGVFPVYPRALDQLFGAAWFACGTAALAFDPICGEGAGNAAREAILACASLRAIADGADADAVRNHYSARLWAGFARHLDACRQFYEAGTGPWWRGELELLQEGANWVRGKLATSHSPRFRLVGFELEPIR